MQRILLLLSCLIAGSAWGQQSTQLFPTFGDRHVRELGLIETANSIFIPSRIYGSTRRVAPINTIFPNPNALLLYKYDKATSSFVDSVVWAGDTTTIDSLFIPQYTLSCYHNGKMYFLNSRFVYSPGAPREAGDQLFLSVIDTNLNILLHNKLVVEPHKPPCLKIPRSMIYHQGKLLATYTCSENTPNQSVVNSRLLLLDLAGNFIKDTLAGVYTVTNGVPHEPNVTGLVKEIGNSPATYVGGFGLGVCNTCLYKVDTNLNIIENYGQINPLLPPSPNPPPTGPVETVEDDYNSTSFSDVINGQLFTAGEYLVRGTPCAGSMSKSRFTFISKHRKADTFRRSKLLLIPNNNCVNTSANMQVSHKVLYSKAFNQIYYVNYNNYGVYECNMNVPQNEVQIVCVDTNLNLKWRKLISPKQDVCARTTQSLVPETGAGLTITGLYYNKDEPGDSTLSGTFLLRFDSAGLLSTGSNPQFTVRDRFNVYPNPATSTIWVEDIASVPAQAFIYDLVGRQVATYTLTGRKNRLELPVGKPGMYLLRIVPQWGEGYSHMVQVTE